MTKPERRLVPFNVVGILNDRLGNRIGKAKVLRRLTDDPQDARHVDVGVGAGYADIGN